MRKKIKVRGLVQGVGFRYFTKKTADLLGVFGFVKNEFDGSVLVEAQADRIVLLDFISKLRVGSRSSEVTNLEEIEIPEKNNETRFRVFF